MGKPHQDSEQSEWIRFVSDVLIGKHKDQRLLLGLVAAANEKLRRSERHVGLQNFSYTPFLLQFSSALSVITPEGYRLLGTQLQLPTVRHHQCVPVALQRLRLTPLTGWSGVILPPFRCLSMMTALSVFRHTWLPSITMVQWRWGATIQSSTRLCKFIGTILSPNMF